MTTIDEILARAVQHRSATVEDIDSTKREILLRAAPYGVEAEIGPRLFEIFEPGTFARAVKAPHHVKAYYNHGGPLVGKAIDIEDRADGSWIRAAISQVSAAADMLVLLEDGVLNEISVEFQPMSGHMGVDRRPDGIHVRHRRAHMRGFAFVPEGAYGPAAYVASVRDAQRDRALEEAQAWLQAYKSQKPIE